MNQIIQGIKQKFRSGQQLEAISECEQACLGHPNDADLKKLAALMLSITGNNQRAKVFLEAAHKLSPDDLDIIFNLGLCCKLISEYENSIHWFGLYIKEKQQDSEAWVNIVDCYIQIKQFDKALLHIRNASDRGVLSEQLTHLNANALEGLKRYEEAIAKYQQVLSANPSFYVAWSNKGAALQKIRQFDSAMQCFDEAIRLKPDYPYVFLNKGFLLLELGLENESIIYFEKAIDLKPDFEEAWFNKGISYTNLKNYPKALDAYKRALDLRPQLNYLLGLFIGVKKQICDWQDYDQWTLKLYQEIELSQRVASPFCMLSITDSLDINFKAAKIDANNKYAVRTNFVSSPISNRVKKNRIRIGYYSPDFKDVLAPISIGHSF
jgi:tetratricopeptide (TPR) repeat protein